MIVVQVWREPGRQSERVEVENVVRDEHGILCEEVGKPCVGLFIPYTAIRMISSTLPPPPTKANGTQGAQGTFDFEDEA